VSTAIYSSCSPTAFGMSLLANAIYDMCIRVQYTSLQTDSEIRNKPQLQNIKISIEMSGWEAELQML
jgi:hypothetical protein